MRFLERFASAQKDFNNSVEQTLNNIEDFAVIAAGKGKSEFYCYIPQELLENVKFWQALSKHDLSKIFSNEISEEGATFIMKDQL